MIYEKKSSKLMKEIVLLVIFSTLFCLNAYSQSGTASITGTISDGQGNIVPGATVALISEQNGRRTTLTNESGVYNFASIQPGSYRVEVEAKGFKKSSLSTFNALVDKVTEINVTLEVGQVTETVNVDTSSIESIVNTQDASIGNNFVSKQIENLPLNGRNVAALLSLQSAVTPDGSVAGSRRDQANLTLDGVDVNDQQTGLDIAGNNAFTAVLRVNPDSVDEFRVTTSNPDASKGRSSGAQISLITKSGTNQFNGALYEYHRNTATTANDFFSNLAGVKRPKLIRNLFGGRIGGPIVKDKLFFFYNYEGMREAKETSVVQTVPLPSLGAGNLRFFDNLGNAVTLTKAQINSLVVSTGTLAGPVVDANQTALDVLAAAAQRYPANDSTTGDGINTSGYRFNSPTPVKQNAHTARFDWILTEDQKQQVSFRANYQQDLASNFRQFPDTPAPGIWSHPLGFAATHTWLVSNNMTNRFSFGLTRLALSNQGDSSEPNINFRDVFAPARFVRTNSRVNPTYNITDDFTWLKGNHNIQFGTNLRIIRNKLTNFAQAYDAGSMNFGFYAASGGSVLTPVTEFLRTSTGDPTRSVGSAWTRSVQSGLTAILGRLSQYTANFNFQLSGTPFPAGSPTVREWATEEYDFYVQDSWKFRPNLTLTMGLRYGLSMPVYETQGYQVAPNIPLQEYFERRVAASARGENYTEPLIMDLAGPANNKPGFYSLDKNNWQPRLAVAWSPNFESGFLHTLFGNANDSVIRGGFAITNDFFGQQLAVTFDAANTLGFATSRNISANTYNITTNPGQLYTGSNMAIRPLPGITSPANLVFPQQQPANNSRRIETSLDTNLVSPINYSWNVSYGRKLPKGTYFDISYIGRAARNLLATRDVMAPNDLTDPKSGQTYYQAASYVELQRRAGASVAQVQNQPFWENLWTPGSLAPIFGYAAGTSNTQAIFLAQEDFVGGNDWSSMQTLLDNFSGKRLFHQNQYAALTSFGTIGSSDYHAMAVTLRQRLKSLTWDLNYTYSKSMDDASGLQNAGTFGSAFILNALRQQDNRAVSDFDLTHVLNFNSVWDIPLGKGQAFGGNMNKFLDAILGGWQLSTIFRYNSGFPVNTAVAVTANGSRFFDDSGWVTNWNIKSGGILISDLISSTNRTSRVNAAGNGIPNLFGDIKAAYNSFRSPLPGESGDRNIIRFEGFKVLDAGLTKSFRMPWSENHKATIRWDVFNVTNSAYLTGLADTRLGYQPEKGTPSAAWGNLTTQQGNPRIMQFAFRYDF